MVLGRTPCAYKVYQLQLFYQLLCPPQKVELLTPQFHIESENGGSKEIPNLEINIFRFRC